MAAASAGVPPPLKVLRTGTVGCVTIRVVAGDIADCATAAVVNAANALSFMPMDAGVSGALRNRCRPVDVTQRPKRWWDDEGNEHYTDRLPETQAGVQAAAGALAAQGVRYVVHAVGPNWNDHSIGPRAFMVVVPKIRRTVQRALEAADRSGAASCTLPALSGGIFTHWREHSNIQAREQLAARRAVLKAVIAWAQSHPHPTLRSVDLCDLPDHRGQIGMFLELFDALRPAPLAAVPPDAPADVPSAP